MVDCSSWEASAVMVVAAAVDTQAWVHQGTVVGAVVRSSGD